MGIVVLYLGVVPLVCFLSFLGSLFLTSVLFHGRYAFLPVSMALWFSLSVLAAPVLLVLHLLRKRYPHEPVLTVWLCGFLPLVVAILLCLGIWSFKAD